MEELEKIIAVIWKIEGDWKKTIDIFYIENDDEELDKLEDKFSVPEYEVYTWYGSTLEECPIKTGKVYPKDHDPYLKS
jgi:hypothetical protein